MKPRVSTSFESPKPAAFRILLLLLLQHLLLPSSCELPAGWSIEFMSDDVVVFDTGDGQRSLYFHNDGKVDAMQQSVAGISPHDRSAKVEYIRMILAVMRRLAPSPRILVIGLGGGIIPRALRLEYPNCSVTVVEPNANVLHVARTYFHYRDSAPVNGAMIDPFISTEQTDGLSYLKSAASAGVTFDAIIVDAFNMHSTPVSLTIGAFHRAVRRVLASGGAMLHNIVDIDVITRQQDTKVARDILTTYFHYWGASSQLLLINATTSSNRIIVALRSGYLPLGKLRAPVPGDELDQGTEDTWSVIGDLPIQESGGTVL